MANNKPVEFKCKGHNCDQVVHYEPETVTGAALKGPALPDDEDDYVVYLACDNGHVFSYVVKVC